MSHNKKEVKLTKAVLPRITPERIKTAWFLHGGTAYLVATCSTDVFKSAIAGMQLGDYAQELLRSSAELDLMSRWYLLCELKTLPLYGSKEEAEQILLGRKKHHGKNETQ